MLREVGSQQYCNPVGEPASPQWPIGYGFWVMGVMGCGVFWVVGYGLWGNLLDLGGNLLRLGDHFWGLRVNLLDLGSKI